MKTNNTNDFSKRTAAQIKSILKANGINAKVENKGDNRLFYVEAMPTIKNLMIVKISGFIRTGTIADKGIYIKAF